SRDGIQLSISQAQLVVVLEISDFIIDLLVKVIFPDPADLRCHVSQSSTVERLTSFFRQQWKQPAQMTHTDLHALNICELGKISGTQRKKWEMHGNVQGPDVGVVWATL